jgi:hypothetical protein
MNPTVKLKARLHHLPIPAGGNNDMSESFANLIPQVVQLAIGEESLFVGRDRS